MRFTEIGQQLRAYRLESGLRAEAIAAQLGVSRAALYRYEKGDVIKLDTIQRLAELLKVSPLSLLGIGTEYYSRPIAYFERIRQIEEVADQLLMLDAPLCDLTTSEVYDSALMTVIAEANIDAGERDAAEQVLSTLAARKRLYRQRRCGIICMVSLARLRHMLIEGIAPGVPISGRARKQCRDAAAAEAKAIADAMAAEPMGLQFGILDGAEPLAGFAILRGRDRATLAANPFRPDLLSAAPRGVAMVTAADEAIAAHQRVAEAQWREAIKGTAGAVRVRGLLETHGA